MPRKVLVVEDEEVLRRVYSTILSKSGYVVVNARDGVEGAREMRKGEVDLVLLDVMMPRLDGIGMLRELRSEGEINIPVLMMTNLTSGVLEQEAKELGVRGLFMKSELDSATLLKQVGEALI